MDRFFCAAAALLMMSSVGLAGEADVVDVELHSQGDRTFRFDVTVRHDDEGWDHYANKWEVLAPDGTVLGTRILHHPHVNEQPFTRSLGNVVIPEGIKTVTVQAYDSVHGAGGKVITITVE